MPPTSPTSSTFPVCSGIEAGLPIHAESLFACGQLLATPAALDLLLQRGVSPLSLLARHLRGDWGDLGAADAHANDQALASGCRLLSRYDLLGGGTGWLITEADRSVTTVLLPDDY